MVVGITTIYLLYNRAFEVHRAHLVETVQSQARLMESVARFDARNERAPTEAIEATLSQIREAHKRYEGYGETGEFTIARLEGDRIVFLISHRHQTSEQPSPVTSEFAEPMRRALSGKAGTMKGVDYRGQQVLAAFEPVAELKLGLVSKIDLDEIRQPFVSAGYISGAVGVIVILIGSTLFLGITNPISRRLEENEARTRAILDTAVDGIITVDKRGIVQSLNQAAERIFGYPAEEVIGQNVSLLMPQPFADEHDAYIKKYLQTGEKKIIDIGREVVGQRKNGEIFPMDLAVSEVRLGGGRIFTGIVRDVSERKESERRLTESENRLRSIIESEPECVKLVDREGRILEMNASGLAMLEADSLEEVQGKHCEELIVGSYRPAFRYLIDRVFNGEHQSLEFEVVGLKGTRRWLDSHAVPLMDAGGNITAVLAVTRDVTQHKQAEQTIRDSEGRFRTLVQNIPGAVYRCACDEDWTMSFISEPIGDISGYPAADFIDQVRSYASIVHPDDERKVREEVARARDEMQSFFLEYRILNARGEIRWVHEKGHVMKQDGEICIDGVILDITDRKRAEESLKDSNLRLGETLDELQRAQEQIIQTERLRALGEMASGIAHDINNSLSSVTMFSSLAARQKEVPDKVRSCIENIQKAAQDATNTVSRMRDFYRQRSSNESFEPVDLNEVVRDVITLTQAKWKDEPLAAGSHIEVVTDLMATRRVSANLSEMREVMTNFIFNAVDALQEGGTIRAATRDEGNDVLMTVSDTGSGMDDETKRRMFEPFFTSKGLHGTGLGLSVCWGIIKRHNGEIAVSSEEEQGTAITIRLPVVSEQRTRSVKKPEPLPGLRLLCIDDEEMVRDGLQQLLTDMGHQVTVANDGKSGLEVFDSGEFDVVITDLGMPKLTGGQVAIGIRRHSSTTPIILLTGWGQQVDESQFEGVNLVLSKPPSDQSLEDALRKVLGM
jgi:PAS domain S-box-containing protein